MNRELFKPVVPVDRLSSHYLHMQTHPSAEPAKMMAEAVFRYFPNPDGNFVEQFQTTGYDSRIFELYLFAYFYYSGFSVNRDFDQPDFIIKRNRINVAIEATTVNPIQLTPPEPAREIHEMSDEEFQKRLSDELPIRFGSPLFSKVNKRYWDLPQCQDLPIVLAVEAFFEEGSLYFSDSSLSQYLYGLKHFPDWTEDGRLVVKTSAIEGHMWNAKIIPSNFFKQPDTEHISAVIFSNSGTYAKFQRMGYRAGYYRGNLTFIRKGICYNFKPNATKPLPFSYNLEEPPITETWGQGLMVLHNPNALHPIPRDYFPDAAESYLEAGVVKTDLPPFYPYMSQTLCVAFDLDVQPPIESITKNEYYSFKPFKNPAVDLYSRDKEWYTDKDRIILGAVLLDTVDNDWVYIILGRDENGVFRWIEGEVSIKDRDKARENLVQKMMGILLTGHKVFPQ